MKLICVECSIVELGVPGRARNLGQALAQAFEGGAGEERGDQRQPERQEALGDDGDEGGAGHADERERVRHRRVDAARAACGQRTSWPRTRWRSRVRPRPGQGCSQRPQAWPQADRQPRPEGCTGDGFRVSHGLPRRCGRSRGR